MEIDLAQGAQILSLLRCELSMPQAIAVRVQSGLPDLPLFVGESGIDTIEDAQIWFEGGADCLLISTSLMLADKSTGKNDMAKQRIVSFRQVFEN